MSHFLSHLVQRTLGDNKATVAPRPASRFESADPAVAVVNTEPIAADRPTEKVAIDAPGRTRRRQAGGSTQALADDGDSATQLQALSERLQEIDSLLANHRSSAAAARSQGTPSRARSREASAPDVGASNKESESGASPAEMGTSGRHRVARKHVIPKSHVREIEKSRSPAASEARMMPVAPSRREEKAPAIFKKDRRPETPAEGELSRPLPVQADIAIAPDLVSLNNKEASMRRSPRQPRNSGENKEKKALTPAPAALPPTPASVLAPQSARRRTVPSGRNRTVAETAPTINVTIGRIEVRAVPAPPPRPPVVRKASRQAPAQPSAMSLDEYLRRRNGGTP
ncbi:MAG TPA: hypothetical protein VE553_07570 [Candidatus Binatia bacterium]|nr:hypothetical protein [Candidatus Binatia bacterium]